MAEPTPATALFVTPPGGVMTKEVGAITGPVEAWIEGTIVRIRYQGADEDYTAGDAAGLTLPQVVEALSTDPGVDDYGNPRSSRLGERAR